MGERAHRVLTVAAGLALIAGAWAGTAVAQSQTQAQTPAVDEQGARAEAREILTRPPFDPVDPPRPFRGMLRRLGQWLEAVGRPLGRLADAATGDDLSRALSAVAVLLVSVLVAVRAVRARTDAGLAAGGRGRSRAARDDPDALERSADDAERAGDLAAAVRLRFRAGVLRLDAAGVLQLRPSMTTGDVLRQVPSPALRGLVRTFEAVAYGGRRPSPDDVEAAREGWRRVFDEARTRRAEAA